MTAPLQARAHETYAYLTTTGRITGEPHRIEIWFGVHEGRIYLLSGGGDSSDWVKNLKADPRVTVEISDATVRGVARFPMPDSSEDTLARNLLVSKYQKTDELQEWRSRSLTVAIDLAEAG